MIKNISSALGCVNFCFRDGAVLGDDKAEGIDLRVVKVIKDQKVKGPRGKDFGLVILGPLTSPVKLA